MESSGGVERGHQQKDGKITVEVDIPSKPGDDRALTKGGTINREEILFYRKSGREGF